MTEKLKTGTTTLGIVCTDGIILAADMRATAGHIIVQRDTEKVQPISKNAALTFAGGVADATKFFKYLKAELSINKLRLGRENTTKELANLASNILYNGIRSMGSIVHFLIGGKDADETFHLYDAFPDGSLTKIKTFIASGSGSVFAKGVLETDYKNSMNTEEATQLAKKALHAALISDSASGNGANIYKITKNGVEKVETITVQAGLLQ